MPSQTASGVGESLWGADPTYEQLMGALFHAPSPDDAYVHAGGAGGPNTQSLLDSDTLAMWSSAPSGFE